LTYFLLLSFLLLKALISVSNCCLTSKHRNACFTFIDMVTFILCDVKIKNIWVLSLKQKYIKSYIILIFRHSQYFCLPLYCIHYLISRVSPTPLTALVFLCSQILKLDIEHYFIDIYKWNWIICKFVYAYASWTRV
jgi:hypothetical protein